MSEKASKRLLARAIRCPAGFMSQMEASAPQIESVKRLIGAGQANIGVFEVTSAIGTRALKIYSDHEWPEKYKNAGLVIHSILGAQGYTPAMHALYGEPAVKALIQRFPLLGAENHGHIPGIAMLMDMLDNPSPLPAVLSASQSARIREMQGFLDRLGVRAADTQLAVDSQGVVWLVDVDRFTWTDGWGRKFGWWSDMENNLFHCLARMVLPVRNHLAGA